LIFKAGNSFCNHMGNKSFAMGYKTGKIVALLVSFSLLIILSSCFSRHKKTAVSFFGSQTAKFSEDDFASALKTSFGDNPADSSFLKNKNSDIGKRMRYVYSTYEFLPLWLNENGNTDAAEKFLEELGNLKKEGIGPERYKLSELIDRLQAFKKSKTVDAAQLLALDTTLTRTYLQASKDLLLGMISPKKADSLWYHANDSNWHPEHSLINTLANEEKYPTLDSFRSRLKTYDLLMKAREHYGKLAQDNRFMSAKKALSENRGAADSLIPYIIRTELPFNAGSADVTTESGLALLLNSYQEYYSIKPTGKLDTTTLKCLTRLPDSVLTTIDLNLERVRWMQQNPEPLYVIVDVPLMELFLHNGGQDAMHMRVVVGKPIRQTPSLSADMANVVINPPWGVPPTILKKDVLPGMQKSGSAYLAKKDLKVFDHKGHEVDASRVNASNYKQFMFKQPPGDDNALGYVKFNLPNKWDIYLHDTPHRDLFDKTDRAQSSGCVRVQQPKEMAVYILSEIEKKNFTMETLDSAIRTQKTKWEILKNKIPVHIVYLTAFDDPSHSYSRFPQDIYKRDKALAMALK